MVGETRALLVEVEGRGVLRAVEERQGIPAFVGMRPALDGRLQSGEPALDGAHVHAGQLGQAVGGFEAHGSRCGTWTCWCWECVKARITRSQCSMKDPIH